LAALITRLIDINARHWAMVLLAAGPVAILMQQLI